jgi:signal transduction histidine kinase
VRERNIHTDVQVPPDLEVHADREMLLTIVRNLLSNAFRHTRESGTVSIRWVSADGTGRLLVENEGDPVSPEIVEKLATDSIGSVQERTTGLGLGLGLCRQLSQLQGGSFSIRATESGTVAELSLPTIPR